MKFEQLTKKIDPKSLLIFAAIAAIVFIVTNFFKQQLSQVTEILLIIELVFLVAVTWGLAAHAVIKALFVVSAELSLIIFLAQSYCATPITVHTADDALMTLIGVGLWYIGIKFSWTIYEEAMKRSKTLKEANDRKWPWIVLVPFALFTGIFVWQVVQVLIPIVQNLCVYQGI